VGGGGGGKGNLQLNKNTLRGYKRVSANLLYILIISVLELTARMGCQLGIICIQKELKRNTGIVRSILRFLVKGIDRSFELRGESRLI
jgi:hypothetical protein